MKSIRNDEEQKLLKRKRLYIDGAADSKYSVYQADLRNCFSLGNLGHYTISNVKTLFFSFHSSILIAYSLFVFVLFNQSQHVSAETTQTPPAVPRCDLNRSRSQRVCQDGVILPVWRPANTSLLTTSETVGKAIVYLLLLLFLFLGVSIIADRFMASIEVITSKEKEVVYKDKDGKQAHTKVRIWNETVSNLTLMALGSSAPEIMLSIIEICGRKFCAGDLGPSTIVGSASFNLFIIIAVCMYVIPDGEVRKVKHPRVFFVTAVWSVLAYIWLYLILAVFSEGVVEIWEGVITFLFFPLLVVFAWVADRRLLIYKLMNKRYRTQRKNVIVETEGDPDLKSPGGGRNNFHMAVIENGVVAEGGDSNHQSYSLWPEKDSPIEDQKAYRKEVINLMKSLKKANPEADMDEIARLTRTQVLNSQPKSRAFYRIQATRKMTGAGNILNKGRLFNLTSSQSLLDFKKDPDDSVVKVFFDPPEYKVLENCGSVELNVVRKGGNLQNTLFVDFETEDGTANAGSDYVATEDTIVFRPGETLKKIRVKIIDDDIFEEDEYFNVKLSNVRLGTIDGMFDTDENSTLLAKREEPFVARVTILDDDHAGIFTFESDAITVSESEGVLKVQVQRNCGSRGKVLVPYRTESGTAKGGGIDFEDTSGELEFDNDEISTDPICVEIIDNNKYNSFASFSIILDEPYYETNILDGSEGDLLTTEQRRIAELGKPRLGDYPKLQVTIEENYEFKNTVDKLLKKANLTVVIGSSSWREQFADALSVNGGSDSDADGEESSPTKIDYVMHYLTVFWKLLFAFVPPTEYLGGWACFSISIIVIGILTAVIGDVASHFGCIVNLNDAVTAVTLVAMGTSVPDTFASKVAAIGDQYADASIGNVTGSNAVNVFLGIGIAWTVAAIYWAVNGESPEEKIFRVPAGNLAFSVTVFFVFACVAFLILVYRRQSSTIKGELGGPRPQKIISSIIFVMLWLIYILLSTLDSYEVISTF